MRKRWVGRSVDLRLLSERIELFLANHSFETKKGEIADGYLIRGVGGEAFDFPVKVVVKVCGSPDNLVVELERVESVGRFGRMFSSLLSFFGGGVLVSRGWKKEEVMERLERRFWVFLEEAVDLLGRKRPRGELV